MPTDLPTFAGDTSAAFATDGATRLVAVGSGSAST
jgi:hypothetical protein